MGFVCVHKKKPKWVDKPVGDLFGTYRIAASYERRFLRAFLKTMRSMVEDPSVERAFKRALRDDRVTMEQAIEVFPFFDPADSERVAVWSAYAERLRSTYESLIVDSANEGNRREGLDLRVEIEKAKIPVVPVSDEAKRWIREELFRRVSNLSDEQKRSVREIIFREFERGGRPTNIFQKIRDLIGLTSNQVDRVENRIESAMASGLSEVEAQTVGSRFAEDLRMHRARTIARTATIDAESFGLLEGWKQARNAGVLGDDVLKKWDAIDNSPKTTDICKDLDAHEPIRIEDQFFSNVLGTSFDRPPAHPNCRSTLVLVFPEG